MGRVRTVIADGHGVVREGIKATLRDEADFEVVGEAQLGTELPPLVHRLEPDLVLLEVDLPEMDGYTCLRLIRRRHPLVKAVVLSSLTDAAVVERVAAAGAAGYLPKSLDPAELAPTLAEIVAATGFVRHGHEPERDAHGFTKRELTIIRAVALGLPNRAIASELWVTEQTVKFHLTNIYRKLGTRNRTEAARAAVRLGVVENPVLGE